MASKVSKQRQKAVDCSRVRYRRVGELELEDQQYLLGLTANIEVHRRKGRLAERAPVEELVFDDRLLQIQIIHQVDVVWPDVNLGVGKFVGLNLEMRQNIERR